MIFAFEGLNRAFHNDDFSIRFHLPQVGYQRKRELKDADVRAANDDHDPVKRCFLFDKQLKRQGLKTVGCILFDYQYFSFESIDRIREFTLYAPLKSMWGIVSELP